MALLRPVERASSDIAVAIATVAIAVISLPVNVSNKPFQIEVGGTPQVLVTRAALVPSERGSPERSRI